MTVALMAFEGEIYVSETLTADYEDQTTAAMTELVNVQDVKIGIGFSELEHTLKKHGGKKAYIKGMEDNSISFTLSKEYTESGGTLTYEPDVEIILNAIRSRTPIRMMALDRGSGEGPVGDYIVTGSEIPLDGDQAQKIACTCKPYGGSPPVAWHE